MIYIFKRRKHLLLLLLTILTLLLLVSNDIGHFQWDFESLGSPHHVLYNIARSRIAREYVNSKQHNMFTYNINIKDACTRTKIEVVIPVHSAITNPRRRNMTRHAKQGEFANDRDNNALLLFFVGIPSMKLEENVRLEVQEKLRNESDMFGDIIQVNVSDTYHNLVNKSIAVLQWISTYCAHSEFVIKIDDDVHIDPPYLLWALHRRKKMLPDFILGELRIDRKANRSEAIKWHISQNEWPYDLFPPFVPGPAIGYPTSTVILLYNQALKMKTIWLDDVFITGICSQVLGIPVLNDSHFHKVHRPMRAPFFVY